MELQLWSPHKRQNQSMYVISESDDGMQAEISTKGTKQFSVGELVWGPHGTFPSWPGNWLDSSGILQKSWFVGSEIVIHLKLIHIT